MTLAATGGRTQDTKMQGSLWLIPDARSSTEIARLIDRLAAVPGGPRFSPHVTLLGGVSGDETALSEATARCAAANAAVPLAATEIEGEETFFRCLTVGLERTEGLLALRSAARALFSSTDDAPYRPHVSLFYGRLDPARRAGIAASLAGSYPERFTGDRLQLVETGADVARWRVVAAAPLNGPPGPPGRG